MIEFHITDAVVDPVDTGWVAYCSFGSFAIVGVAAVATAEAYLSSFQCIFAPGGWCSDIVVGCDKDFNVSSDKVVDGVELFFIFGSC